MEPRRARGRGVSQERHPEHTTSAARASSGPSSAACCPSSCSTATRASRPRLLPELTRDQRERYVEANAAAVRAELAGRPRLRQPRPARRPGRGSERRALRGQGARLRARVLDARQRRAAGVGEGVASAAPGPSSSARITSARVLEEVVGHVDRVYEVPPGVDVDEFRPSRAPQALAALLDEARRDPPNPARRRAPPGRRQRRAPRRVPRERRADRPLLRQADPQQGRPPPARGSAGRRRPCRDRRLRRLPRRARAPRPAAHALHRPARAPPPRPPAPAGGRDGRAVDLPRGVRDGRRRSGRRRARRRWSRATPACRDRRRARGRVPARAPPPDELRARRRRRPDGQAARAARALRATSTHASQPPRARRSSSAGAGRASPSGCSNPSTNCSATLGDSQRLTPEEQLRFAREQYESAQDFTLAVEEEFAILDPETLGLPTASKSSRPRPRERRSRSTSSAS